LGFHHILPGDYGLDDLVIRFKLAVCDNSTKWVSGYSDVEILTRRSFQEIHASEEGRLFYTAGQQDMVFDSSGVVWRIAYPMRRAR
jgi:hypothetical protein